MLSPVVVILILVVVNIPVYALVAWIVFDDLRNSAESIVIGLLKSLTAIISLRLFVGLFVNEDEDNSMFNVLILLATCALIIYGEYCALKAWWPSLFSA